MSLLSHVPNDLRYAARAFRREPSFAGGVVLTFALAIGANAAMFGLVERLMLAPPPGIADAGRVVRLVTRFTDEGGRSFPMSTTSYPVFRAVASLGAAFADAAAAYADSVAVGRGAERSEVASVAATGRYFATLGVRPALGRLLSPADDVLPSGADVVVLGYAYWQRQFAGARSVVGREIVIDDQPLTIVGVAARGFNGTDLAPVDVYVPLSTALRKRPAGWWSETGTRMVAVVARLRDAMTEGVASEMAASAVQGAGADDPRITVALESIVPGGSARESPQGKIALWLSGVSLVVLLLATANVGTLLLLRAARRRRDVAVHLALGASRARLAGQSLMESLLLAVAGGAIGLLLARWFGDLVRTTLLPNLARAEGVADARVLAASIAVTLGAGLVAGLAPLADAGRRNVAVDLRSGGTGASGRFVAQRLLAGAQVALCMVLVVGAGLFVRSLSRVRSQDLGFSTAHLLQVTLEFRRRPPAVERDALHEQIAARLATLPGVTGATVVQGMPFSSHHVPPISIPGLAGPPGGGGQLPIMYGATPAYLDLMHVVLREGRGITDRDAAGAPLVVLVNETMAETIWPGEGAIGKCVRAGYGDASPGVDPMAAAAAAPCREVVGVVRDSRARSLRLEGGEGKLMQYYVPFPQLPRPPFPDVPAVHGILVRTAGDPSEMAATVQRFIQGMSPAPLYARVRPYQTLIDPQLRSWRLGATLFPAFGELALGIAAVGLFAVVSYLVAQRTRELGVRLALGGTGLRIAALVLRDALRLAGAGAGIGLLAALAAGPLVRSMLFQTSPRDATILIGAAAVLFAVTVTAAMLPAWRASRVSPMTVLRSGE
jgi:putative ABC transport system permease protein